MGPAKGLRVRVPPSPLMEFKYKKEIAKAVPLFIKNPSKLPFGDLDQESELKALEENKELLEKEFNTKIEILVGDSSEKGKKAWPGRIGLLIEGDKN